MSIVSPRTLNRSRKNSSVRMILSTSAAILIPIAAAIGVVAIAPAHAGNTVTVTMTDEPARFVPQDLKIKAGTTVVWKNTCATLAPV